jgi:ABC-type transporter Mla subunit MlaD
MGNNASRNPGVKIIASFEDCAVPLNTPAGLDRSDKASRSANEGIRYLAAFEDDALPLSASETDSLDTLNVLFAQHEQKIQRLVNKLQGMIEELKKQNAEMKSILLANDQVINRYYLDGPREDDI